jgi:hypothetical protein
MDSSSIPPVGVVLALQRLHGQAKVELDVVNVEVNVVARALPAASLTRGSMVPPRTLTVNVLDAAKGEVGVSVATRLVAL